MSTTWAYIRNFVSSPSFQEKQPWVIGITRRFSVIPAHYWTGSRFFGSTAVCLLFYLGYPYLSMAVFLLFALTDWVDGKVARFRGEQGGFGAKLDGAADKVFILPIIAYLGHEFSRATSEELLLDAELLVFIGVLWLIEGGGYLVIWIMYKLGRIKKEKSEIYEHIMAGKYKFAFQVVLVGILWIANNFGSGSMFWLSIIYIILGGVIVLAALSVAGKIDSRWAI